MKLKYHSRMMAAVCVTLLFGACNREADSPPKTRLSHKVTVMTVEESQFEETERVPGYVRAGIAPSIEAKIAGRIHKVLVKEGDQVQAGQMLAEIDANEIQAKLEHALAAQRQASQDLARIGKLLPAGAVTKQEYDNVVARSRMADAAVKEASVMVEYSKISAPFNGLVSRKFIDEGDFAQPGRPLFTLEKKAQLRFEADPAESLASTLKLGDSLSVYLPSSQSPLMGTIEEMTPTADLASGTQRIKILLPDNPQLRSGQYGHVEIPIRTIRRIAIPETALILRGQLEVVFVAKDAHAELRLIRVGRKTGEKVQVLSGLRAGDRLITSDLQNLRDGDPIEEAA